MKEVPISAYQETSGLCYFARMLDKVRKFAAGVLREDFHENLGAKGKLDGMLCDFLQVDHAKLTERTLQGGSDEDIFDWCQETGRQLSEIDKKVWNAFASKLGWNDYVTPFLEEYKAGSGFADRPDIQTMFEYYEFDEGRKSVVCHRTLSLDL